MISSTSRTRAHLLAAALVVVLAGAVFVACGGTSSSSTATPPTTAKVRDIVMTPADFPNINTMTPVDGHFVANLRGHLAQALAVAHSKHGGVYPVGTLIQLVPQEAMVKRSPGYSPKTHDWEFFFLQTTAQGTKILTSGTDQVVNRFGGNCASCHLAANPKWDMVCEHTHGCAPLPVGDDVIAAIQRADPRPR